jgi:hypothetical protein
MKLHFIKYVLVCAIIICTVQVHANKKTTNWKKSYSRKSKEPYGTFLAYEMMQKLFTKAKITDAKKVFKKDFEYTEELPDHVQLKFFIAYDLEFSDIEIEKLLAYVADGNYAFLSAQAIDQALLAKFGLMSDNEFSANVQTSEEGNEFLPKQTFFIGNKLDNMNYTAINALPSQSFLKDIEYEVDGDETNSDASNQAVNTDFFDIFDLGGKENGDYNFMMVRYGKGKLFLHSAPLLFTNYCMLQDSNRAYVETAFSNYIPQNITDIKWHQYLYRRRDDSQKKPNNPLSGLMKYPMWMMAIILTSLGLLLYVLFNGKRRQREVPIIEPTKNTSIEFAETIGQLYYNNLDHKNLAEKMIAHLLDKIRTQFNIVTNKLDEEFVQQLSKKSGASMMNTSEMISKINTIRNMTSISADQLVSLYSTIQQFNQHFS